MHTSSTVVIKECAHNYRTLCFCDQGLTVVPRTAFRPNQTDYEYAAYFINVYLELVLF